MLQLIQLWYSRKSGGKLCCTLSDLKTQRGSQLSRQGEILCLNVQSQEKQSARSISVCKATYKKGWCLNNNVKSRENWSAAFLISPAVQWLHRAEWDWCWGWRFVIWLFLFLFWLLMTSTFLMRDRKDKCSSEKFLFFRLMNRKKHLTPLLWQGRINDTENNCF